MSVGFIILRHFTTEKAARLWKECYRRVRQFYPANPVMIIDDNSHPELVDTAFEATLQNTQIIKTHYPGRAELLPYYYFHKLHPFEKAVILQDSMFLTQRLDDALISAVDNVQFFWHFKHNWNEPVIEKSFIKDMSYSTKLLEVYDQPGKWIGCLGAMSVITWQFLNLLQEKHNFLQVGLDFVTSRPHRMAFERVFGVLCHLHVPLLRHCPSMFGDIHNYMIADDASFTLDSLINMPVAQQQKYPIYKIWNGR